MFEEKHISEKLLITKICKGETNISNNGKG
jgi:hypothetical protein